MLVLLLCMLPYFANNVSAWQLCQLSFDFMIVFTPVCDNERVVFIYNWNYTNDSFLSKTLYC